MTGQKTGWTCMWRSGLHYRTIIGTTPLTHKQCALLLYQAQKRCCWHLSVGSSNSWSLARINQDLLDKAHKEVFKQFRIQRLATILQVHLPHSLICFSLLTTLVFSHATPPLLPYQTPTNPIWHHIQSWALSPPLGSDRISSCTAQIVPMP